MANIPIIKACLMGGGGQGKSALVLQFITGEFLADYDPTIEDTYSKTVTVNDYTALVEILDTAGQEVFWSMQEQWIRESEVFLLVFSITSRDGFKTVDFLRNKILEVKATQDVPMILVGTGLDLATERLVSLDQAQQKATRYNCEYIEVSAFNGDYLNELFEMVIPLYKKHLKGGDSDIHDELKEQEQKRSKCKCMCCGTREEDDDFDEEDALVNKIAGSNNKIQFFKAEELPPDSIPSPILSLKNFRIARMFYWGRFFKAAIHGIFVPLVVIFQTFVFLTYSERSPSKLYPDNLKYDDPKQTLSWDYLGMVVGRKPGQDPEAKKNKKWFLRQTAGQKCKRVIITMILCVIFVACCYNVTQVNNKEITVSLMESVGPFLLFWAVWFLLSVWIGYEQHLKPKIPLVARLRSLTLFFGDEFTHQSSVYKFIRAFQASRTNNRWKLNKTRTVVVIFLGLLYALTPGLTRLTIGDASEGFNGENTFFSKNGNYVMEIGAILVNFVLVSSIIYCVEIQYKKQFDNMRMWITDLTNLLDKPEEDHNAFMKHKDDSLITIPARGSAFSKDLFISLTRRQNALGWLEIRSFLGVQSLILFGEQELPTLWLILITCLLTTFCFYRTFFFVAGDPSEQDPLESILFNGTAILAIICLIALFRILITAYQFEGLQVNQEKLITKQKFFMRCNRPYDDLMLDSHAVGILEYNKSQQSQSNIYDNPLHGEEQTQPKHDEEYKAEDVEMIRVESKVVPIKFDSTYPNAGGMSSSPDENQPFLNKKQLQNDNYSDDPLTVVKNKVTRIEDVGRYSYNVSFVEDVLTLVVKKDVFPRLFKVKLNTVLSKVVTATILVAIVTVFGVYIG